jgi:peptidoglycan-N-acetylglucosamine deacetylase
MSFMRDHLKWMVIVWLIVPIPWFISCRAEVITRLPTTKKVVAITFDACETKTPAYFDQQILDVVLKERLPCTLFVSGKFAERNREQLTVLATLPFIQIENHSLTHPQHMEVLPVEQVTTEVLANETLLAPMIGYKTRLFRFPAGNYDQKTLDVVEALGYQVVHWTFASGDPARTISAEKLTEWVLFKTKPGSILIFHMNGRGYRTAEALPTIVTTLSAQGYRFVTLREGLALQD